MLIALCSDKGSPGTTTTALALASRWPTPAALVEADPYGGDLAIRMRTEAGSVLPETPTVLTLATAARTSPGHHAVSRYGQRVNDQLLVVPGFLVAEQGARVADWEPLAALLPRAELPVMADVGRLHAGSPVLPVAAAADVVVVVGRADTASIIRLRERTSRLVAALVAHRESSPRLFPVLVGPDRHGARDTEDLRLLMDDTQAGPLVVGIGHIAYDTSAVERLEAGQHPAGLLARTKLMRSARRTASQLSALVENVGPQVVAT